MLEAKNISFGYTKGGAVIENVALAIAPSDRLAITGRSGRGKTTLCKLLAGYLEPTSGSVTADGAPLPRKGACPVQLVFQHPELAVDPRKRMANVLEEAGAIDGELNRKFGINKGWLSRFPHELSGGELQRFCIVRALMTNPRYIIADEISTMLDAVTQAQIWEALLRECDERGAGLVFVSHSPALSMRIATRKFAL